MYYARININGGALCLPIPNNNQQTPFKTVEAAKGRLEVMGSYHGLGYGYDKGKGRVQITGQVLNAEGQIVWSIAL